MSEPDSPRGKGLARFRSVALDVSPLKESPSYRALLAGQLISVVGTQMAYVAVAYQVFALTNSTVAVGLIGLAEAVPLMLFSILGGAIADSRDRRSTMARAHLGMMLSSGALALVSLAERPPLVLVFALVSVSSAVNAIDRPARTAIVPSLVSADNLPAAIALRQVVFQTTQIIGPAVGGLMLAAFPIAWVYAIDAATFLAGLGSLYWVPRSVPVEGGHSGQAEAIREGLVFAFRTPLILSIFVVDLVAMVFGMPRAVFPELAGETFGIGPEGLGLLYAAPSAGALCGALMSGWVRKVERQGMTVLLAVVVWGVAITLAGLTVFSLILTLLFLAVAGAADVFSAVFRGTMLIQNTPDPLRGRVSALNHMVVLGGPRLGDLEAGIVGGLVGAPASIVIGGAACMVGTGLVAARFPSLRHHRRSSGVGLGA
ncbi:MAG: MFS transporter [Actinomycetota bacterium]